MMLWSRAFTQSPYNAIRWEWNRAFAQSPYRTPAPPNTRTKNSRTPKHPHQELLHPKTPTLIKQGREKSRGLVYQSYLSINSNSAFP
ncbi:MAG: hypothetical protein PHY48_13475 [Candidatus Cloacimonetes bacterium]|nr:hypothetical protein [Candidatus Cloacimonadota bacterium]